MSGKENGADTGQMLAILHGLAEGQQEIRSKLDEHGRLLTEHSQSFVEVKRDMAETKLDIAELKSSVSGLRESVTEYHAAVLGHGVLFSQLEERVRRIDRHLDLPPAA